MEQTAADGRPEGGAERPVGAGGQLNREHKPAHIPTSFSTFALKRSDIDRGWAWPALFASFLIMVLIGSAMPLVGMLYIRHLEAFRRDAALTACIGALMSSIMNLGGPLAGWICSKCGRRICVIAGGLLVSGSLAVSSQSYNFWVVFITNGILAGIGLGLVTTPSHVNVGCYFVRRRPLASGICVTGFPIGILLATPFLQYLEEKFGWRGALLIYAGVQLNLCLTGVVMRPSSLESRPEQTAEFEVDVQDKTREPAQGNNSREHRSVYTNIPYYFFVIALLFTNCSINIVYVHIQRYVYLKGSTDEDVRMMYLAFGICGCTAKVLTGLATGDNKHRQSVDKLSLLIGSFSIVATVMFVFPYFAHSQIYRVVGLCLIGFYYNLEPALYVPYTVTAVGFSNLNEAIGFLHLGIGLGFFIGPPCAAYVTSLTRDYDSAFYVAGCVNLLAIVSLIIMVIVKAPTPGKTAERNKDSHKHHIAYEKCTNTKHTSV